MSRLNYSINNTRSTQDVLIGACALEGQIWALTRENLSPGFANNNGAGQPAHPRSLISTFVIHFLESIKSKLATSEISFF